MRRWWSAALLAASVTVAEAALSQGQDVSRAKELFDAGAREYETGRFDLAIQAFEQAYKIAPRDGIVFSMAQAHRRQFTKSSETPHLFRAVELYRQYIDRVKTGGRVTEAFKALGDLEPQLKLHEAAVAPPTPEAAPKTRIVVNIFVPGTLVSIDGGTPTAPPVSAEVSPGKHTVRLTAPGYFDETRDIAVAEGEIAPANLPQRERPAALTIDAIAGAEVSIDGRFVGEAPLLTPIELPSGRHFVAVLKTGHETYTADVDLVRGTEKRIAPPLETTVQRDISYGVFAVAASFVTAGVVFSALAFEREGEARALLETQEVRHLYPSEVTRYEEARRDRSLYTGLAIGGGGAGVALALLGAGLVVFDKPRPVAAPRLDGPSTRPGRPAGEDPADIEVSAAPLLGPGLAGAGAAVSF